jgi:hypothetical protein
MTWVTPGSLTSFNATRFRCSAGISTTRSHRIVHLVKRRADPTLTMRQMVKASLSNIDHLWLSCLGLAWQLGLSCSVRDVGARWVIEPS